MLKRILKNQNREKLKRVRKVVYWKNLIPDFKTLALASLIIPNFFEQEFLATKQCNKSSLCHKTNRNRLIENVYKKYI